MSINYGRKLTLPFLIPSFPWKNLFLVAGKDSVPLFLLAYVGAGGDPNSPEATNIAAAIEMLHAFALAHDDVMDRSEARRGEPSILESPTRNTIYMEILYTSAKQ